MNQLTLDFFNNPHPGFIKKVVIQNDILATDVPIVELDLKLDTSAILNEVLSVGEFDQLIRPTHTYEKEKRISNWYKKHVYQTETMNDQRYYTNLSEKIVGTELLPTVNANKTEYKSLFSQLNQWGIEVDWCHLMKLEPQGWLTPHRDINNNMQPLRYFWIPLNWPEGNKLRIYPIGDVKVKVGSMYLLNQRDYIHSVLNLGNQNRYILNGMFNILPENEFKDLIDTSIKQQY